MRVRVHVRVCAYSYAYTHVQQSPRGAEAQEMLRSRKQVREQQTPGAVDSAAPCLRSALTSACRKGQSLACITDPKL